MPGEELRDGARGQDFGAVAFGDTLNLWLQILVRDNWHFGLERVSIGFATELESLEILSVRVPTQYLAQNPLLNRVAVSGHLLDELESLHVLLVCRTTVAQWR